MVLLKLYFNFSAAARAIINNTYQFRYFWRYLPISNLTSLFCSFFSTLVSTFVFYILFYKKNVEAEIRNKKVCTTHIKSDYSREPEDFLSGRWRAYIDPLRPSTISGSIQIQSDICSTGLSPGGGNATPNWL